MLNTPWLMLGDDGKKQLLHSKNVADDSVCCL